MKRWKKRLLVLHNAREKGLKKAHTIYRGKGRRLAISDVHGCYVTFQALLDQVDLQKDDQLFLLGDLVNRGPYSNLVLERLLDLLKMGYSIYPLRGNHEQEWLMSEQKGGKEPSSYGAKRNARELLDKRKHLKKKYRKFFECMPWYYKTDVAYLVHGGFDFSSSEPFKDYDKMLQVRNFKVDEKKLKGRMIVHGHNPAPMDEIEEAVSHRHAAVPIDNGCVKWKSGRQFGRLLCLDIDQRVIYEQQYCEHQMG